MYPIALIRLAPHTHLISEVIFAYRVEHIEGQGRLVQGANPVDDSARDAPYVTRPKPARNAPDGELELPFEQNSHLLVGMRMVGHDRSRLEANHRQHQVIP